MKTMTPSNICSGFHTCGVHPFNPDAINCGIEGRASHNEHSEDSDKDNSCGFDESNNFLLKHWQGFRKDMMRGMICMM